MPIRLHDTSARAVREFRPVTPGRVTVYLCGATVQGGPHIGHLRSAVCFDILVRWLEASGYQVTYCRNVTDIDDKIIAAAGSEQVPCWALAERNQREFTRAYDTLGCRAPDVEPRATGHIPEMVALIRRLIDTGHAYQAHADVYFDVGSAPGYGDLSGQHPEAGHPEAGHPEAAAPEPASLGAASLDAEAKRDPRDFALWKGAKPGEPLWDTPWGPGRPGWHLECSAMATKYLGPVFDIHGGGIDLLFPHHENERAQSTCAGDGFARYWLHHGLVQRKGVKLSKSEGNVVSVAEALTSVRPPELRYYLAQAHYHSPVEYSEEALEEAAAGYQRIERFVTRAEDLLDVPAGPLTGVGDGGGSRALPISFTAAMDADLSVPAALAAVHATVHDGNYALSVGDRYAVAASLVQVREMLAVLGLDPLVPPWSQASPSVSGQRASRPRQVINALVRLVLRQREAARGRGDYASADSIRDTLEDIGVVVEDTPNGPRWELKR